MEEIERFKNNRHQDSNSHQDNHRHQDGNGHQDNELQENRHQDNEHRDNRHQDNRPQEVSSGQAKVIYLNLKVCDSEGGHKKKKLCCFMSKLTTGCTKSINFCLLISLFLPSKLAKNDPHFQKSF